ncbi:DUF4157 domain-containing protein [Rhodobacteraceae bacterium B1Z28]|uniref:DUF4157 domain-containing protein n=1 Tax=Ruegeria haliotis TaxID=2747601 RepID=A0ABX2PXK1_9RHOB|nr:DUF4157 domain-containing protein [Ruegeria haliotis]NVO58267.1 DUF4157 domain-containing protein [Ruegeria haliotis]
MLTHANSSGARTTGGDTFVVQRACDCDGKSKNAEKCPSCVAADKLGIQGKYRLNRPGDAYEQEADRTAERVTLGGAATGSALPVTPLIQRMESGAEEEEELQTKRIQRQAEEEEEELQAKPIQRQAEEEEEELQMKSAGTPTARGNTSRAAQAVQAGGRPLSRGERSYFEPRFGHDLGAVRLHTDAAAQTAARGIGARAYTLKNSIAFAPGEYAPDTNSGRRLLAHEITHTLQQGGDRTIRRTCPANAVADTSEEGVKKFETKVDEIKALDRFKALKIGDKRLAKHIIDGARGSACPMYYMDWLEKLIKAKRQPKEETAKKMRKKSKEAVTTEETKMEESRKHEEKTGEPLIDTDLQENTMKSKDRKFKRQKGEQGKYFKIDDRDPTSVFVKMKVWVRKKGTATNKDRDRVEKLEDAIERQAETKGYMLDLDFVRRPGIDIFSVHVDPSEWPTSANWISGPGTLAHEAHHLLKLEDRYNYIKSHARNPDMEIGTRLHWFREQMMRSADPLSRTSMMKNSHSTKPLNEEDICALVKDDYRGCLVKRFGMRPATDIESVAKTLSSNYTPQKAALLEVMRDAWDTRPFDEQTTGCDASDPLCGLAPDSAFGDANIVGPDASRFPLKNPHVQEPGRKLKRTKRARKKK